jgi:hypothetical protein
VNKNPEQTKAQKLMAKVMIDPATQIAFNSKKGSEPARLDIDPSKLDAIAQYGMKALQKPDQRIPTVDFLVTPDFIGAQRDLAGQLWANKSMTADQFVNAFVKIVEPKKRIRKRPFSENPASREKWRDTPKDSGNGTETETRTDRLWNQRYRHGKTEPQKDGRRWSRVVRAVSAKRSRLDLQKLVPKLACCRGRQGGKARTLEFCQRTT